MALFTRYYLQRAASGPQDIDYTKIEIISSLIPDWKRDHIEEAFGPVKQHGAIHIAKTPGEVLGLKRPTKEKPSNS